MKISEAKALGLCKICGSGRDGECMVHQFPSMNYRNTPPGECALTDDEIKTMKKDRGMKR